MKHTERMKEKVITLECVLRTDMIVDKKKKERKYDFSPLGNMAKN